MRILVLERNRSTADAIAGGLASEEGIEVAGTVHSIQEVLERAVPEAGIDGVVTTLNLGESTVLDLARELRERDDLHLVVAGLPSSPPVIARYMEAGVDAYLTEEMSSQGLGLVVKLLQREEVLVPPPVGHQLIQRLQTRARILDRSGFDLSRIATLTSREREVLEEVARGASNREVADRLFIEVGTVKSHVHAILDKLGVRGRDEARQMLILHRSGRDEDSGSGAEGDRD